MGVGTTSAGTIGASRGVLSKAVGCIETDKAKGMLSSLHYDSCVARRLPAGASLDMPSPAREKDSDDDDDDDEEEDEKQKEEQEEQGDEKEADSTQEVSPSCSSGLLLAGFESGGVTSFDLRSGRCV